MSQKLSVPENCAQVNNS